MKALLLTLLLSLPAPAETPAEKAVRASGAKKTDPIETKIALLLHLQNYEMYFHESSLDPAVQGFAQFKSTPEAEAKKLIQKYAQNSSGAPYAPYDLDSARSPEEMLTQRIGGTCGTQARVFAELARQLNIPQSDIKIVSAVCDDDYDLICPGGKNSPTDKRYRGGASGHVFVLLKVRGKWKIINTTFSPLDGKSEKVRRAREALNQKFTSKAAFDRAQADALAVIRNLDSKDLEAEDFYAPEILQQKLNAGEAAKVPIFASLPEFRLGGPKPIHFRQMTVFDVADPDQYLRHQWKDRSNLIASGKKDSDVCRFSTNAPRARAAEEGSSGESSEKPAI